MSHQVYKVECSPKFDDGHGFRIVDTFYTGFPSRDVTADRIQRQSQGRAPYNYNVSAVPSEDAADHDDWDLESWPEDPECEGHESLRGDSMGVTVYCPNNECRKVNARR